MLGVLNLLHKEETGQDLIEYALIGLLISFGRNYWHEPVIVLR